MLLSKIAISIIYQLALKEEFYILLRLALALVLL